MRRTVLGGRCEGPSSVKASTFEGSENINARVYTVALWSAGTQEAPAPVDTLNCGVVFAAAQDDPI